MQHRDEVKIRPIILSGGCSKNARPLPHDYSPRQFARLLPNESLFSSALRRVSDRSRYAAPFIIGNSEHRFFILETLQRMHITDATVMLERSNRNTATAAILAALHETEPGMLHLFMPSDYHITNLPAFHDTVSYGQATAAGNSIVMFGIPPKRPDTEYDYIIPGQNIDGTPLHRISIFTEAPNATFARILINQGALWNSSIFLYYSSTMQEEAKTTAPEYYRQCQKAFENATRDKQCITLLHQDYEAIEGYSFEALFMEQTERRVVMPGTFGWSHIGSWTSLWQIAEKNHEKKCPYRSG